MGPAHDDLEDLDTMRPDPHRRLLLKAGALGSLGMNLAGLLRAEAGVAKRKPLAHAPAVGPIRSCILIFYYGGPSHLDTWDMKPGAPREVRGEFRPIGTSVPGLTVSEHLPRSARVVDRLA